MSQGKRPGKEVEELAYFVKANYQDKRKKKSVVQFQLSFAIFVAFPEFTQNAVLEITAHDGVFALKGHRYPIINSGDTIALRSAYTSGSYSKYWLHCVPSYCYWSTCPGIIITSSRWTSCSKYMMFTITAKGKTNGEPINSGDTVSLRSNYYSGSYRLYCNASSDTLCKLQS